MSSRRATKIVATLGPASSDPAVLEQMIRAGVNVMRLNFSHGSAQDHCDRAKMVREAAARAGTVVGIMADLQGPKIRISRFVNNKVVLEVGAKFILDAARTELGDQDAVGLDYKNLPHEVKADDVLLAERRFDRAHRGQSRRPSRAHHRQNGWRFVQQQRHQQTRRRLDRPSA